MKPVGKFNKKGLIELYDSMWITTEPCIVNKCMIQPGSILASDRMLQSLNPNARLNEYVKSDDLVIVRPEYFALRCDKDRLGWSGHILSKDNLYPYTNNLKSVTALAVNKNYKSDGFESSTNNGFNPFVLDAFLDKDCLENVLSPDKQGKLADISSFSVMLDNGAHFYTKIDGIKGLYVHEAYEKNSLNFVWLTHDDVVRYDKQSKYGVIKDSKVYNLDDSLLNTVKFVQAIHEGRVSEIDGKMVDSLSNLSVSKLEYNNIKTAISSYRESASQIVVSDYVQSSCGFEEGYYNDYDELEYTKVYVYNHIYFNSDVLPNDLEIEPFNMLFNKDYFEQTGQIFDSDNNPIESNNCECFLFKNIDVEYDNFDDIYCDDTDYICRGDILKKDGIIVKNAITVLDVNVASDAITEMRNMAFLSGEYKESGSDFDIEAVRLKYLIPKGIHGGDVLRSYDKYRSEIKAKDVVGNKATLNRDHRYTYDNFGFKTVSESQADIVIPSVSIDKSVDSGVDLE